MKTVFIVVGLAVAVICAIAWMSSSEPKVAPMKVEPKTPLATTTPAAPLAPPVPAPETRPPAVDVPKEAATAKPADTTMPAPPLIINGYEVQDPMARIAVSFVGSDPDADAYWLGAINDPAMPAEERKDLIEDLNEDGLSDPQHPGPDDMPLILNRLRLLQRLALNPMDDVNADAIAEAGKDLQAMLQGEPHN